MNKKTSIFQEARLSTSGGQERNISSCIVLYIIFFHFPSLFLTFFLNLVFRAGGSSTREGPGYATGLYMKQLNDAKLWIKDFSLSIFQKLR